jgi:hypothetical protein
MSNADKADLIIGLYYIVTIYIGLFCVNPKLAFYISVFLAIGTCSLLFYQRVYIELGGFGHTIPFAFVAWLISRYRQKRRAKQLPLDLTRKP